MRLGLRYKITEKDLKSYATFPVAKVLQAKYRERSFYSKLVYLEFMKELKIIVRSWKQKEIESLEEANSNIYNVVRELREKMPNEFDEGMGWWEKKELIRLWEEGKIGFIRERIEKD